jgi:hypothetical protein
MNCRLTAVPVALLAVSLLAGCGGNDDAPAGAGKAPTTTAPATPPTTPPTQGTDAGASGGRVIVEQGLPSGFPEKQVPLIDADVVNGTVGEPGSPYDWSVVLQPHGKLKDLADEATARLERAGFETATKTSQENLEARRFRSQAYEVGFTATRTGDGVLVTYVVTKR